MMTIGRHRDLARALRRRATEAEKELWRQLRARLPLEGTYFRRQVPIGLFIVDFACFRHRLVVELDGSQHGSGDALQRDAERTKALERHGFRVLRFWNHQVFAKGEAVLDTIAAALAAHDALVDKHPGEREPLQTESQGLPA